jgi:protein-S-isoprenylcysteine O-methyltransferase Ste14
MHGIPFSMYLISWIVGHNLPEGVLWGHTLFHSIGLLGMYINIACAVAALALILSGWYAIYKKYWSKETGKGALVTSGIYRYIRHPQYTGLLLMSLGMLIEWATLPMLILYPVMIFLYVRLARREERDMLAEFGDDYRDYMKRTNGSSHSSSRGYHFILMKTYSSQLASDGATDFVNPALKTTSLSVSRSFAAPNVAPPASALFCRRDKTRTGQ